MAARFKLIFFSPPGSTQKVLDHLFSSFPDHVGKIGEYGRCAFVSRGVGQFLPLSGANPHIGQVGTTEKVEEDRVELIVNDIGGKATVRAAVAALRQVSAWYGPPEL
jgi:hypothetical protein